MARMATTRAWRPRLPDVGLLVDWFIPAGATRGRTELELARTFVFTHLFGPVIAQPMAVYLWAVSPAMTLHLAVLGVAITSFWALPFALRWTGDLRLASLLSFQLLAAASLFGAYHYGGFSSPFLPWLIVSLMLGLVYLSRSAKAVLLLFALDVAVFLLVVAALGMPRDVAVGDLAVLGWLSIGSATVYMTWMALHYARIIGLRSELEEEIERQRATAVELQRARALAEDNERARLRFFAKMSHELRTPLNAIIGYSDILLEDCGDGGEGGEARGRDVSRINAAGRHLLSLVADVLDPDRIGGDGPAVEVAEFALGELCDEVVATALPMVEANGNRFVVACPDREHRLRTDATKLRQILLNLLSNAGKFTAGGVVRLDLRVEPRAGDDQLVATVGDTGIGIGPEALPRLFTDYEQADASTFSRFGGTGIGLALSRKLSILLNGEIGVTSRPGHGSTFTLTVPTRLNPVPEARRGEDGGPFAPPAGGGRGGDGAGAAAGPGPCGSEAFQVAAA